MDAMPNFPPEIRAKALCEWLLRERGVACDGLQDAITLTIRNAIRAAENDALERAAERVAQLPNTAMAAMAAAGIRELKHGVQ